MKDEEIAAVAHNIDVALCESQGDQSPRAFNTEFSGDMKKSHKAIQKSSVAFVGDARGIVGEYNKALEKWVSDQGTKKKSKAPHPGDLNEILHDAFRAQKNKEGWSYGKLYNIVEKTSPLLKAYVNLTATERVRIDVWLAVIVQLVAQEN